MTTTETAEAKARAEHNVQARANLRALIRSFTQGEWLTVCRLLGMNRPTIAEDDNLVLLAAAYVKEKRDNGVASLEVLLELTDEALLEFHGFAPAPAPEAGQAGAEEAQLEVEG